MQVLRCYADNAMESLPLFPLPLMPLPGEQVGLFIFEPRYQALFDALEALEIAEFGIPFAHAGRLEGVGAVMRLIGVTERFPDGRRHVLVTVCDLFRLVGFDESPAQVPYPLGEIQRLEGWRDWTLAPSDVAEWDRLSDWLAQEEARKSGQASSTPHRNQRPPLLLDAARVLSLDARQRAALLVLNSNRARRRLFSQLLEYTRLILNQEQHMDRFISPN